VTDCLEEIGQCTLPLSDLAAFSPSASSLLRNSRRCDFTILDFATELREDVRDMWDTEPAPYWDAFTFLYGGVDQSTGIGYWFWIWSIGGQSLDGSPILCQSAPGAPVVILGAPYVDPTIGSI
jgi:hypothetical protein